MNSDIVADRAEAYYRLIKQLRKEGSLDKELEANLKEQWWVDVQGDFV